LAPSVRKGKTSLDQVPESKSWFGNPKPKTMDRSLLLRFGNRFSLSHRHDDWLIRSRHHQVLPPLLERKPQVQSQGVKLKNQISYSWYLSVSKEALISWLSFFHIWKTL